MLERLLKRILDFDRNSLRAIDSVLHRGIDCNFGVGDAAKGSVDGRRGAD